MPKPITPCRDSALPSQDGPADHVTREGAPVSLLGSDAVLDGFAYTLYACSECCMPADLCGCRARGDA